MISENKAIKAIFVLVLFLLGFGSLVLLFATIGLFYSETVVLSIIVSAIFAIFLTSKINVAESTGTNYLFLLVILISLAVSFASCFWATPTVFGGRDQGSISSAAINLTSNHHFKFSTPLSADLFKKYGPGKALNFPGFDYASDGNLITRFPLGFTSYLGAAYALFGLRGLQYANLPFLFLFLVIFWLLLRQFFSRPISFLGFLISATFFPFLWFAKYTLTETYSLFLIWAGILSLIYFVTKKENIYFYIGLFSLALSAFVRIEGIVFLILAIIYFKFISKNRSLSKPKFDKLFWWLAGLVIALYMILNFPTLLDSAKNITKAIIPSYGKDSAPSGALYQKLLFLFFDYNFLIYIIAGLTSLIYLFVNLRKNYARNLYIPAFILFPSILYIFFPLISLDDPWMFRRYVFAAFPLLILYSIYTINKFFYHKVFLYFTFIVLILANIVISVRFIDRSENKELLPQIEKMSQKFGDHDLILVDRLASGSGFSLLSEPLANLYHKNAVYFFNLDDLESIDERRYANIYLIAPIPEQTTWYLDLLKNKSFEYLYIENSFLTPSEKNFSLAQFEFGGTDSAIWKIK
jgi:hypothetical protein